MQLIDNGEKEIHRGRIYYKQINFELLRVTKTDLVLEGHPTGVLSGLVCILMDEQMNN